jgi:hypothetical protein
MTNSPLISRSQLLLQYLMAGDIELANEGPGVRSLELAEPGALVEDSECLA